MDIQQLESEHSAMFAVLVLIGSGAIYGDNCRAIANTTINELAVQRTNKSGGENENP